MKISRKTILIGTKSAKTRKKMTSIQTVKIVIGLLCDPDWLVLLSEDADETAEKVGEAGAEGGEGKNDFVALKFINSFPNCFLIFQPNLRPEAKSENMRAIKCTEVTTHHPAKLPQNNTLTQNKC